MATQSVKDILNTEVPKPSFVLSPSVAAPLPSEMPFGESGTGTGRSGKDNVARTLDPYSGKFKHVPEDTPRVYGSDQSLLVEAASRTNQVPYSTDFTQWSQFGVSNAGAKSSLFEGEQAYKVFGSGNNSLSNINQNCGFFSGNTEVVSFIAERGSGNPIAVDIRNGTSTNVALRLEYDWSDGSFNVALGSTVRQDARVITENGPATNSKVVRVVVEYSGSNSENVSGESRQIQLLGDRSNNGDSTTWHHAQLEEAPNASSPIVTQGSPVTRSGDDYAIFEGGQPDWWNPDEGSFILEVTPQSYNPDAIYLNADIGGYYLRYINGSWEISRGGTAEVGSATPFQISKIGFSILPNELRLSVDGSSDTDTHDGELLTGVSEVGFGSPSPSFSTYGRLRYVPRALPESTLNILTS